MGNHASDLTPPHARGRPAPTGPGGAEAYAGVRVEAMPGLGGRAVADALAAAGGGRRQQQQQQQQHRGSSSAAPARAPQTVVQKTKLVKNACHIHKDSLRLTRMEPLEGARYQLHFRFDAEAPCRIAVYYLAEETRDASSGRLAHRPRFPPEDHWVVGPHPFGAGSGQSYSTAGVGHEGADLGSKVGHVEGPHLIYVVIRPDGAGPDGAAAGGGKQEEVISQVTVLSVEPKAGAGAGAGAALLTVRVVKQKLETPQGVFVLQEIYGVAGVAAAAAAAAAGVGAGAGAAVEDAGGDPGGADCVVCLTNKRELAILPCRHMCVCRFCAAECIRSQDSKCPICRNPAEALLKLTCDDDDDDDDDEGLGARA